MKSVEIDPTLGWVTLRLQNIRDLRIIYMPVDPLLVELVELPQNRTGVSAIVATSVQDFVFLPAVLTSLRQRGMDLEFESKVWDRIRLLALDMAVLQFHLPQK